MDKVISLIVCCIMVAGCGGPPPETISDLRDLPQDVLAYVPAADKDKPFIDPERQAQLAAQYKAAHYAPWHRDKPKTAAAELEKPFADISKTSGHGPSGRKITPDWVAELKQNANLGAYPNTHHRAVTVHHADLRDLPTLQPRFLDFDSATDGYPFDLLQCSGVWAGTPVLVTHVSNDGAWLLVETPFATGWMRPENLAYVDDAQAKRWESCPLAALTKEGAAVRDEGGRFRFTARIGMALPQVENSLAGSVVLAPAADVSGNAVLLKAVLPAGTAETMPLAATPANFAAVANQLIGQSYGWGGLYELRDCSATLRDLFAPFGLYLPRNSGQQKDAGTFVPLTKLPPEVREREILDKGMPMLTLIRAPGHIMLYLGRRDGRAIVLQNFWGVPVKDAAGREARFHVGQCAITTLTPGAELPNLLLPKGDGRKRVEGMTFLLSP